MSKQNYIHAAQIGQETEIQWLVESLWLESAVGIIGGEPKSYKSFLALELSVAIASKTPAFGKYPVVSSGPVLIFAAEDSLSNVRRRLEAACDVRKIDIDKIPLYVLTMPRIDLQKGDDRKQLEDAISEVSPKMLILDPFVRLHSVDENSSTDIAPLLSYLRTLQRQFNMAVAVVHHARKRAGKERPGQSLRGSGEFHAWGDSNLYVKRVSAQDANSEIELTVEHRSAASMRGIFLGLNETSKSCPTLQCRSSTEALESSKEDKPLSEVILGILKEHPLGLKITDIRARAATRHSACSEALQKLVSENFVKIVDKQYTLVEQDSTESCTVSDTSVPTSESCTVSDTNEPTTESCTVSDTNEPTEQPS